MINKIILFTLLGFLFWSCEKGPGEGGLASIEGKLYVYKYNGNCTELRDEYYAIDQRVYIIAGNEATFFDNVRTGPDGTFLFKYLRKGKYKIYAVAKNCNIPGGEEPVFLEVEIKNRKEKVVTPNLEIIK